MTARPIDPDEQLAEDMAGFFDDPLGFVLYSFNWGEGDLLGFDGPDDWQRDFLDGIAASVKKNGFDGVNPVPAVQCATSSGHGIGKSALTSWLILWIMSTRPFCKGVVTANTAPQLESKTWAELAKWMRRCVTKDWFEISTGRGSMKMYHKDYPDSWRVDAQTCREENSESFAGLHAANSSPFYIFDEASAIPSKIWEVAEGGLTDGEPFWFTFGNPTRNSGRFFECFNRFRHRWTCRQIDSRTAKMTNKAKIAEWAADHGEDSDFMKVRVRGMFPSASSAQFIPSDIVQAARKVEPIANLSDPLIIGVDVARFGDDQSVIRIRRGRDARTIPPVKLSGADTMQVAARVAEIARKELPDAIFIDGGGVGGGVIDRLRQLGIPNVIEVNFGGKATMRDYRDMSAQMWGGMREWLANGGAVEDSNELESDLTGREYSFDGENRYVMERKQDMKSRGLASPDDADALALTFAYPVGPRAVGLNYAAMHGTQPTHQTIHEYDPYA
jgi:hypothetical protein